MTTSEKLRQASKAAWRDPAYRAKRAKAHRRPAALSKMRAVGKANWKNPEYRARHSVLMKAKWADPKFKAEQSRRIKRALKEGK